MPVTGSNATNRINFGKATIYIGTTAPAVNTALTLTAGVPSDGFMAGVTMSDCVFKYTPTFTEIMIEQQPSAVEGILTGIKAELDCDFGQTDVTHVLDYLSGLGTNPTTPNDQIITVGSLIVPTYQTVLAVQQRRDDTSKYVYVLLYRVYVKAALQYAMSRTKPSSWKVTFEGLADVTRTDVKDQLFQIQVGS